MSTSKLPTTTQARSETYEDVEREVGRFDGFPHRIGCGTGLTLAAAGSHDPDADASAGGSARA
jgi:hypothetical protein